jgi:hypothetical protein
VDVVDLTPRVGGLVPLWAVAVFAALWVVAIVLARQRFPHRWPGLPGRLTAVGALLAGNVLFFWRPLFSADHIPRGGGDLNSFFFPLHVYSASRIQAGEFPAWNPYLHGGMSHLGNFQAAVLYPPNVISFVVARSYSYGTLEWLVILHFLVASLGAYALGRALGMTRTGAVVAGLVFAYSGFLVAHLGHYSMISAAVWLPWLLLAVQRMTVLRSWRWAAVSALIVFLVATGGHQQTLLYVLVFTGIWWLFWTALEVGLLPAWDGDVLESARDEPARPPCDRWYRTAMPHLSRFGFAVGGGLGLAGGMILPSLQVARRSVRSTLSYEQASEFSVQPIALLQLVLPKVFGSNPTDHWGAFSSGEIWGYAGVVTLVLAGMAVAMRRSPVRLFFAVAALLALLFALGPWTPLHGWAFKFVPLFDLVRAPARAYLYLNLSLAMLAGFAVSQLGAAASVVRERLRPQVTISIRVLVVVLAAATLLFAPLLYAQILGVDAPANRPVIAVDNLNLMILYLALLLGILWLARNPSVPGTLIAGALAVLVVVDLFGATATFNPTSEDLVASYREPEVEAFLAEQRVAESPFRIDTQRPGLQPNFGLASWLQEAGGLLDPMQPAAYSAAWSVASREPEWPLRRMFNVRYLVRGPDQAPTGEHFEVAYVSAAGTTVWQDTEALPRAWFVARASAAPRIEEALDLVLREDFDPAERVVLVTVSPVTSGDASGRVELVDYRPERIELIVEADGPGYVVLADGDSPGWTATVDGEARPVLTANAVLRAVAVDGGAQRVVVRYESRWVTAGVVVSLLSALVVLGMGIWDTRLYRS